MYTIDESNYLRGLLLLAEVDGEVLASEKRFIIEAGASLGFEKEFCSEAAENIKLNENIDRNIPMFRDSRMAEKFLEDGYKLARIDNNLSAEELNWLKNAEQINKLLYTKAGNS